MRIRSYLGMLVTAVMLVMAMPVQAATQTYQLDPNHTYVQWRISHFGFSYPSGKWLANGTLTWDAEKPQNSKVDVIIQVASIDTGIPALDEHLRSKAFFDVEQYPTATFVSNKVQVTGKDTAKVTGMLTLHGVAKPVTLNVKLNKVGINPITERQALGFSAEAKLNRSEFNMDTLEPGLGDEVKLTIEAEAELKS